MDSSSGLIYCVQIFAKCAHRHHPNFLLCSAKRPKLAWTVMSSLYRAPRLTTRFTFETTPTSHAVPDSSQGRTREQHNVLRKNPGACPAPTLSERLCDPDSRFAVRWDCPGPDAAPVPDADDLPLFLPTPANQRWPPNGDRAIRVSPSMKTFGSRS